MAMAMFGGLFTGLAEAGLFVIYYNRRENQRAYRDMMRKKKAEKLKKRYLRLKDGEKDAVDEEKEVPVDKAGSDSEKEGPLRRRVGIALTDTETS